MMSRLVSDALAQNLDLARASARMAQARAGLGIATAAPLPSGNVSGEASRAYQSVEIRLGQVLRSTPDYNRYGNAYETNLDAGWEIDVFGGLRRGRQSADISITLRGLQARLAIADAQVRTRHELLEKVQLLHSNGVAPEYQVRQSEGELAQVQATVPELRTGIDAAMNALDVISVRQPVRIALS